MDGLILYNLAPTMSYQFPMTGFINFAVNMFSSSLCSCHSKMQQQYITVIARGNRILLLSLLIDVAKTPILRLLTTLQYTFLLPNLKLNKVKLKKIPVSNAVSPDMVASKNQGLNSTFINKDVLQRLPGSFYLNQKRLQRLLGDLCTLKAAFIVYCYVHSGEKTGT